MLAAHAAFTEGVWLRDLCSELKIIDPSEPSRFWCDNKSTIFTLCSETMSWKQTHLQTKFFWCSDMIQAGHFLPDHIDGEDNPSDMFTKGLPQAPLEKHIRTIGMQTLTMRGSHLTVTYRRCMSDMLPYFAVFASIHFLFGRH